MYNDRREISKNSPLRQMIIDKILFRNLLDKGEKILMVAHVHPFIVYGTLFKVAFLGLLIPALGYFLFPPLWPIWISWVGFGVLLFGYRILQWYLDAWIITNLAVIDHEWNSFVDQTTNRIEYGNIDAISNEIKGFWGTFLRFGNIQITHVSGSPLVLNNVTSPRRVERFILEHQQKYVKDKSFDDHSKLKELLTKLLRDSHKSR